MHQPYNFFWKQNSFAELSLGMVGKHFCSHWLLPPSHITVESLYSCSQQQRLTKAAKQTQIWKPQDAAFFVKINLKICNSILK
jgi:hypothetical protein